MRKVMKRLGNILFYGLMLLFIVVLAQRALNPSEPLRVFGYTPTVVMSESMLPTLQVYSYNMVKDVDVDEVEVGDIIVYRNDARGMNIIHRVYEIEEVDGVRTLRTWGDNNAVADSMETTEANLLGKVTLTMNWPARVIQLVCGEDFRMSEQMAPLVVGLLVALGLALVLGAAWLVLKLILKAFGVDLSEPEEEEEAEETEE